MHSTGINKKKLINNKPSTSKSSFPKQNKTSKRRKLLSAVEESSYNEDTQLVQGSGKSTLNTFSDYESGDDDVEKAGCSMACFSRGKTRVVTKNPPTEDVPCTIRRIQFEDLTSGDSDDSLVRLTSRRGSLRALSDYETETSIDRDKEALMSRLNSFHNSSQQNDHLDLSSEDDSVYKVTISKCKNPLNLFSTSDSSDSDAPVRQQRFRKRKRINTSSEDENVSVIQSHRRGRAVQTNIQKTNGSIRYPGTRPQTTRQLRPRINNRMRYTEAESSSSSDEILGRIMISNNTEAKSDSSSSVELLRSIRRHDIDDSSTTADNSSDSNEEDVMEGSRFTRRVHSVTNVTNTDSTQQNSILRRRDNRQRTSNEMLRSIYGQMTFPTLVNESQFFQPNFDSSDSDNVFEPRRLRRGVVQIHYSDSDSNSEQTFPDIINNSTISNSVVLPNTLISSKMKDENSSDSDADSEKCPICFCSFGSKEVASPVSCDHSFCTKCIQEWAKSNNTCPIDRKLFNKILVRPSLNGRVIHEIPVESPSVERFWSDLIGDNEIGPFNIINTDIEVSSSEEGGWEEICCVCFLRNNSHNLIVCDLCLDAYHLNCITPPLRSVPVSDWFCPPCNENMD